MSEIVYGWLAPIDPASRRVDFTLPRRIGVVRPLARFPLVEASITGCSDWGGMVSVEAFVLRLVAGESRLVHIPQVEPVQPATPAV
jgi:hypothetical protein